MQRENLNMFRKVIEMLVAVICCVFFLGAQYGSRMVGSLNNPASHLPPNGPQSEASITENAVVVSKLCKLAYDHINTSSALAERPREENEEPQVTELNENDEPIIVHNDSVKSSQMDTLFDGIFIPLELKSFILEHLNFQDLLACRI